MSCVQGLQKCISENGSIDYRHLDISIAFNKLFFHKKNQKKEFVIMYSY